MIEIERKFLVKDDSYKQNAVSSSLIRQGFLSTHPERVVRVRQIDSKGFITVKGKSNESGTSRFEWEKEITAQEAISLFTLCEETLIEKVRYMVAEGTNLFYEVDEFLGANEGLIVAEIELPCEDTIFNKPDWLGKEVTGIVKYYNSMLAKNPFCNW